MTICSEKNCLQPVVLEVDRIDEPEWERPSKDNCFETIGCPFHQFVATDLCYYHKKKKENFFNRDDEYFRKQHKRKDLSCPWTSK